MYNVKLCNTQGWLRYPCSLEMEIVLIPTCISVASTSQEFNTLCLIFTGTPSSPDTVSALYYIDLDTKFTLVPP